MESIRRFFTLVLFLGPIVGAACSSSTPTSLLLTIQSAQAIAPEALRLDVYTQERRVVSQKRLPDKGTPTLPSTVVIFPRAEAHELRLVVRAEGDDEAFLAEGIARIALIPGKQISATLTLQSSRLPDRDGDLVPDEIDRCPDIPNPMQGPCTTDGGLDDGPPRETSRDDGIPDALSDVPLDTSPDDMRETSPHDIASDVFAPDLPPCNNKVCPLGCNTSAHRCYRIAPHGGVTITSADYDVATAKLVLSSSSTKETYIINTDTGEILGDSHSLRPAHQPGVAQGIVWRPPSLSHDPSLFIVDRLEIPTDISVEVRGTHPLLIYARHEIVIAGHLLLDAKGSRAGAGGYDGGPIDGGEGASCDDGQGRGGKSDLNKLSPRYGSGGGGGSFGTHGGDGGDAKAYLNNTPGGSAGPSLYTGSKLHGGCGGGGGGGPDKKSSPVGHGGFGGGGGGALQLVANGPLTLSGTISAQGAGGGGGGGDSGGGGGGAGGMIVLEALKITLQNQAIIAANGGGGGGAGTRKTAPQYGANGQGGQLLSTCAPGGEGTTRGGDGGCGGARKAPDGVHGAKDINGGGGGGGAGIILFRSFQAVTSPWHTTISPAPSTSPTLLKW